MGKPLVSVVIPVYNGSTYVRDAIESVLAQTYPSVQIIAVNDGSTDDSLEVLRLYEDKITIIDQVNQGVSAARNAGINAAKGKYIAFLDQDDWWESEKLEKQIPLFLSDEKVALVHTAVAHYDESTGKYVVPLNPLHRLEQLPDANYETLLMGNPIYNSSAVVRSDILQEVGCFRLEIEGNACQDYDLWLRIAPKYNIVFLPEKLATYRLHSAQGIWDRRQMLTEEIKVLKRSIKDQNYAMTPELRKRFALLYDELATAYIDAGDRREARRNYAKSLRWHRTHRAALLWWICLVFPMSVVRSLQRIRKWKEADVSQISSAF